LAWQDAGHRFCEFSDMIKYLIFSLILILNWPRIYSQKYKVNNQEDSIKHMRIIQKRDIPKIVDSLKYIVFKDTLGLNNSENTPIFIVNGLYSYHLDNIAGKMTMEFNKEILNYKLIRSIFIVDRFYAFALYGIIGEGGAVLIKTKKLRKFNPEVAGLKRFKDKPGGDNLPVDAIRVHQK